MELSKPRQRFRTNDKSRGRVGNNGGYATRLASSGVGHDVVLPALIGGCLLLMWRCVATALGRLVAIEARADSIHGSSASGLE